MSFQDEIRQRYRTLRYEIMDTPRNTRRWTKLHREMAELRGQARLAQRLDDAMRGPQTA